VAQDAGVDLPCSVYADQLVAYNPAGSEGGSEIGNKALGAPDGDSVPLTTNGVLSLAFIGLGSIVDETGDDIQVHGSIGPGAEIAVYVGFGDTDPVFSGSLTSEGSNIDISIASASTVSYVQLVGIAGEATIDALESLQTLCP
jgi:hypothetical protein